MTLAPQSRLGPYEILALLGEGGMGEVYRARDTRLGRDVAIKVLPAHLAPTPEARARFEREARAISSLSHPHICTLHDVGHEQGIDFLVMEYLEGETLAHRLERGPLPLPALLQHAIEISGALQAAHRRGLVHRDLKPGNIMLTKAGAKLLDFGLARTAPGAMPPESTTMVKPLTAQGVIVGTFQYMAPEQIEGKEADARSDLWALGCVLYEMATGMRAFEGKSQASLFAAILEHEPVPISIFAPLAPPALERVVKQCLAKDREDRWQSAGDVVHELRWIAGGDLQSGGAASAAPARGHRERWAWGIAGVLAIVAGTLAVLVTGSPRGPAKQASFQQVSFRPGAIFNAAFAPDAKTIVYSAASEGNVPEIFMIRPEYPEPQPLGARGMTLLSVSSKGELAVLTGARFIAQRLFTGTLARMPLGGGAPREMLEGVQEADWSPDGQQLAIIREVEGKDRLEYPIGRVLHESAGYLSDLRVSPQGDRIAYFEHPYRYDDRGSVDVVDLHGKNTMLSDGFWGEEGIAWTADGKEILFSASESGPKWTIYAVTPAGKRRIALESAGGLTVHDVAPDGRWLATRDDARFELMVHTAASREERDLSWLDASLEATLSQDGETVLFHEESEVMGVNYAVCLRKTDGSAVVRLGEGASLDLSPDGRWALAEIPSIPPQLMLYPTGAGEPRRLPRGPLENYAGGKWFPDGRSLLICGNEPGKATRSYVQDLSGGPPRAVSPEGTSAGVLSPDGKRILAKGPEGKYFLYLVAGGEPRPVPWLSREEQVIRFGADGKSVLAFRGAEIPCRVERVDLQTGHRELFKEIAPQDRVGLMNVLPTSVTDDERSYAYTAARVQSTLFVVDPGKKSAR